MKKEQATRFADYINAAPTGAPFEKAQVKYNAHFGDSGYTVEATAGVAGADPTIFDDWNVCLECMGEEIPENNI